MLKEVQYPLHIRKGLRPLLRDYPLTRNLRLFGSDSETINGDPLTLQICGPFSTMTDLDAYIKQYKDARGPEDYFEYVDRDSIFPEFWRYHRLRIRPNGVNITYFHNLNFDLRVLFRAYLKTLYEQNNDIAFETEVDGELLKVKILFGKVNKAEIVTARGRLQVLDSKAFSQASLAKSLQMFRIPQDKLEHPEGLGTLNFGALPKSDARRVKFEAYSLQDARAECGLGLRIMEFHEEYKVPPCLSLPAFAAKVFRRHFLRANESIPFPPLEVVKASELSYHGGKNGFYLPSPQAIEDLYEVDINSAYPDGMKRLPGITKGEFYSVNEYVSGAAAIYCISGTINESHAQAKYRLIFNHAFKPVKGEFKDLWHTSWEMGAIIDSPCIKLTRVKGYVWRPAEGSDNPFARFVDHFYHLKETTPKKDPNYHFYKIVLNALYGKLVSTIEVRAAEGEDEIRKLRELGVQLPAFIRIDEKYDKVLGKFVSIARNWRAGSLYNPFLASLITGYARRYLYDLETQLEAYHSATDSVKTKHLVEGTKGLGGVKVECYGRCYLFRNKLYLHFSKDATYCGHKYPELDDEGKRHPKAGQIKPPFKYPNQLQDKSPHPKAGEPLLDYDGQHLCKVALHGYKGPLWVLFDGRQQLLATGKLKYQYTHVVGLREGLRRGLSPCDFIQVPETLSLYEEYVPDDLLTFIKKRGGFSLRKEGGIFGGGYQGEIKSLRFKETRIHGLVSEDRGISADMMREAAAEAGFIWDDLPLAEFMELVRDCAMTGRKYYGANEPYQDIIYPEADE
jgi:hypothetical protein